MLDQEFSTVNQNASPWPHAMRYGVIWALIGITIQLVMYSTGLLEATMAGEASVAITAVSAIISFGIAISAIVLAIRSLTAEQEGVLTYGKAVGVGALTGLVYGVITAIWAFIFFNFIFSGYEAFMEEAMIAQWEAADMDEEAIEAALSMSSMFMNPIFAALATIPTGALYGTIISLIAGLIMKTE